MNVTVEHSPQKYLFSRILVEQFALQDSSPNLENA